MPPSPNFSFSSNPDCSTLALLGSITSQNASTIIQELQSVLNKPQSNTLIIDLQDLSKIDDYGVSILASITKKMRKHGVTTQLINGSPAVLTILNYYRLDKLSTITKTSSDTNFLSNIGTTTIDAMQGVVYTLSFLGDSCLSILKIIKNPKSLRVSDTLLNMRRVGVDALPIVGLISFLLGLIMAFMSSVQLKQFGANIYVASLVALSMTRELGPIMTAIIVAGRSSSAFAAEIGSMKISEEIDALYTMGINPHHFLVMPRLIAALCMMPLLTLFSDVFAIAGGLLVGISMLDLTVDGYINQTIQTLKLFDVFWGVLKSCIFALLLGWTGCLRGFQVTEGADGVGRATTSAVVTSIFLIILSDSLLVVILRYWQ